MTLLRMGGQARPLLTREHAASVAVAALTAGALVWSPTARTSASDHIDSPTIAQDRASDIDDMWAFLDPNDNSKVVMLMSTQGFIIPGEHFGEAIFDKN